MTRHKLSNEAIATALALMPGWTREGDTLVRRFEASSYREAANIVARMVELAERADHHPDLTWSYRTLTISLTTHDSGGITFADVNLAEEISSLLPDDKVH